MTETLPIFHAPKTRRLVSAWVVGGEQGAVLQRIGEFDDIFDQIILCSGTPQPDGSLNQPWPLEDRRRFCTELRQMGISPLLLYGGKSDPLKTPGNVAKFIDGMLDECRQCGADGVDIDFEHWPAVDRFLYTDFIAQLSQRLHAEGLMLSACVYPISMEARRETGMTFIDDSLLATYVDHFRYMVYDLYCPPSQYIGPTSMAPWGRETMTYAATRVPRHKIIMGLPTYSVDWDMTDPKRSRQVNDYEFIAECEKQSPIGRGWCYYWDVNLIRYTDELGHPHALWVSDAKSTKSHLVTVDSQDLQGVCFWLLQTTADPAIWQVVREHFNRW